MKQTKVVCMEELITKIDRDNLFLYLGNGMDMDTNVEKRIVLFTHEAKRSGAPSVLFDMSKVLMELGYTVFLISPEESEFLVEFIEQGVNVICYENFPRDMQWITEIAELFPVVLVNTLSLTKLVTFLAPIAQKLYWWIHEAEIVIENSADAIRSVPKVPALQILAASPLIQRNLKEYTGWDSRLLNFYIEDVPKKEKPHTDKIKLFNVGNVNGNKGQDILAAAFDGLPDTTKEKCELYFCACNDFFDEETLLNLLDYVDTQENVHMMEGMPKKELYDVYDEMDIIVVASYYESTSAVAVEGMMKEKLCICTETCGVCEYLKDEESVLTFPRGDVESLRAALDKAINQYEELENIRKNGRLVYEQVYTKPIFKNCLKDILEEDLDINSQMNKCTGCGACKAACPVGAITLKQNEKGFVYPVIDKEKCIQCKKCVTVCPVNGCFANEETTCAYAFKRKETEKLLESQSGGAFAVLAEKILSEGGVVYGASLDEACKVTYLRVDNLEDLGKLKGSKYVQADLNNTYTSIQEDLKERKVLFSGTPCYVAGLTQYLGRQNTDNLLTCDLICHGVPSPAVYESHLTYLKERFGKEITDFNFRDKKQSGWHTHMETFTENKKKKVEENTYASIFYTDACLRESCYSCSYANAERVADVTIGDLWGVEKVFPDMDDNQGVSLVLANSAKGQAVLQEVFAKEAVEFRQTELASCMQRNLNKPTKRPSNTEEFWNEYLSSDYKKIVRKYGQLNLYNQPNFSVLNCWEKKLDRGESLSNILKKRGIQNVLVCGNKENNKLVILELQKGRMSITGEVCFDKSEATGLVPGIKPEEIMTKFAQWFDTILVTNESDMVDVLSKLHSVDVPMEKITPLSFVLDEEV